MLRKILLAVSLLGMGVHTADAQRFYRVRAHEVKTFTAPYVIETMQPMGNKLVFFLKFGGANAEMWTSDGTPGGTVMLKDGYTDADEQRSSAAFRNFVSLNGKYYLSVPVSTGPMAINVDRELTLTDFTTGGTSIVDIRPGDNTRVGPSGFILFDGNVFFNAIDNNGNPALHKHDGTAAPVAIPQLRDYDEAVVMNNELYFDGVTNTAGSRGLYKMTDATAVPVLVSAFATIENMQVLGNRVIFWGQKAANDGVGKELYVSDGTAVGTTLLMDVVPGGNAPLLVDRRITLTDRVVGQFTVLNGNAYFQVRDASGDFHLYRTDGTPAGTALFYTSDNAMETLVRAGNNIVFNTFDTDNRQKMFATDGIAQPKAVTAGRADEYYNMTAPAVSEGCTYMADGRLVINGGSFSNGGGKWNELLITDGTGGGTKSVLVVTATDSTELFGRLRYSMIGDTLYFVLGKTIYKADLNALEAYTPVPVSVADVAGAKAKMSIFPNPVTDGRLTIDMGAKYAGEGIVSVYDINGAKLAQMQATVADGRTNILLPQLPAGTYHVKLVTGEQVSTAMFVTGN